MTDFEMLSIILAVLGLVIMVSQKKEITARASELWRLFNPLSFPATVFNGFALCYINYNRGWRYAQWQKQELQQK